ncbi:biotin--[acetyl-CoA-carboxylase] ligase [Bacillus thermotolerans]|uniref:Bifunctional ligase/repressor BirA n=1 Tax=Bacillus thermotolerans TaxID=1221996 RepID=A0A0F5HXA3_BACTR|nr:biotin--[acetyl-CoA-carboxylase] ligase [Bacillus thermotolerans]KKB37660.1 Biotin--protein ligase / Biotin operon repressor [Bacillus thermotolerans]KKB38475.1 Biotin--protein ligase [Bacillus thermotolerans]KKB39544.1 Biotin--protein ligase / Biotin operon repressor [Bacillus thermotolerans]
MQSSVRQQLLSAFSKADGGFVSGQALAEILGCSRTAIWKHIEALRQEGFELEAVRKKGYRIVSKPDKVTENEILIGLETNWLGKEIVSLDTTDSTQKEAHRLAQEPFKEGTVVIAEEQTAGRGRMARQWHSPKHTGIWMSVILKPELPPYKAPQFTLLTAVSVVEAIREVTGLQPEIKWPNDILLNGKKLTGILTELQADADRIHSVIIGIGINVNQLKFPEELKEIATSLAIEKGEKISRSHIIQEILKRLEHYYHLYIEEGFSDIKRRWERYALSIGKRISARTVTGVLHGKALGITEEGVLKLLDDEGVIHNIYSADIEVEKKAD